MRIVIDLQYIQKNDHLRDPQPYALSLALAIARNRGSHEVIIALNGRLAESVELIRTMFSDILPLENIVVWFSQGPLDASDSENTWRRKAAELLREAFLANLKPDIVLITSWFERFGDAVHSIGLGPNRIPTAMVVYEMPPLLQPLADSEVSFLHQEFYTRSIECFKKADLYLVMSDSLRSELVGCLGLNSNKISNIFPSVEHCFQPLNISENVAQKIRRKFGLIKPFIMYSGGAKPLKSSLSVIKAFSLLSEDILANYQLALVGHISKEQQDELRSYMELHDLRSEHVIFIDDVCTEESVQLYNLAELFIVLSGHEGYGLPALEAMSCGTATIGANTANVSEIIGYKNATFDPLNVFELSQKINDVLTNQNLHQQLVENGFEQVKLFSWDNNAKIAIATFEQFQNKSYPPLSESFYVQWLIEKISCLPSKAADDTDLIGVANAIAQNHPKIRSRQLLIDISGLVIHDHKTGIQRVVRSIVAELIVSPPHGINIELVYANPHNGSIYRYAKKFTQQFLQKSDPNCKDEIITVSSQDIFIGLDLAHRIVLSNQKFYEHLRLIGAKVYFVVYDLLPILRPEVFPTEMQALHSEWMGVIAKLDGLLCISQAVADDVIDWLNIFGPKRESPLNIGWFHLGADLASSVPSKGLPHNYEEVLAILSSTPTFLMVGTLEPRKRQLQALLAFERLWAQGYTVSLVIVGKYGWNVDFLVEMLSDHPELNRHLFWFAQTSDEFLEKLYATSSCLIAASSGEGFGLPIIEAAQHGIPIIARDIPVFREIASDHAYYFKGNSAIALAKCITDWLDLDVPPSSLEIPWITWKKSKEQLLNVVLNEHWYHKWDADNILRRRRDDTSFPLEVARGSSHVFESPECSGYLVYVPSITLEKGTYEIAIHGRWNKETLNDTSIEFAQDKGQLVLLHKKMSEMLIVETPILLTVSLQRSCNDFEVHISLGSETEIDISMIEIKPIIE